MCMAPGGVKHEKPGNLALAVLTTAIARRLSRAGSAPPMSLPSLLRPHSLRHVPLVSQTVTCARRTPAVLSGSGRLVLVRASGDSSSGPGSRQQNASAGMASMAQQARPNHVVEAIVQDHKEIKTYYEQFKNNRGNPSEQEKWSNQYMWEVARHSVGEELVVYPAMEKHVKPDGKQIAEKDRAQHQEVKNNLHKLENKRPGKDPEFESIMDHTMRLLDEHMHDEESHDLVRLREAISEEDGRKLAREFERTKMFAPTRPHPTAGKLTGNKPPFETVVGLLSAPLDKLRDAFKKFPSEEELERVQPH